MTTQPISLNLDAATFHALEWLCANDGQSLQSVATRLIQDALATRKIAAKAPLFEGFATASVDERKSAIAKQAQALAVKFNRTNEHQ